MPDFFTAPMPESHFDGDYGGEPKIARISRERSAQIMEAPVVDLIAKLLVESKLALRPSHRTGCWWPQTATVNIA